MPSANLINGRINGRDLRPRLKIGERGQAGTRWWLVDTDDETEAVLASGLPALGDPWDVTRFGGCTVRDIGPAEILGGGSTGGHEGWSVVPVQYSSNGYAGQTPLPRDVSDQWSEIRGGSRGVQVYYGVDGSPGWQLPIHNGTGLSIESGDTQIVVRTHLPATAPIPLAKLISLSTPNKINDRQVLLPPIYRTSNRLTFNKGELRFKEYAVAMVNNLIQISCTLVAARDHTAVWTKTNDKGLATAVVFSQVYEEADFGGVW